MPVPPARLAGLNLLTYFARWEVSDQDALCALRVSLGWDTTEAEIDRFVDEWGRIIARARWQWNNDLPRIIFKLAGGIEVPVDVEVGTSVLEAAWNNKIDIEGACEGAMACSTCHVILGEKDFDKLDDPSEEEEDLLDLA